MSDTELSTNVEADLSISGITSLWEVLKISLIIKDSLKHIGEQLGVCPRGRQFPGEHIYESVFQTFLVQDCRLNMLGN